MSHEQPKTYEERLELLARFYREIPGVEATVIRRGNRPMVELRASRTLRDHLDDAEDRFRARHGGIFSRDIFWLPHEERE